MSGHVFDPTILRAYDIRGIFEQTLTRDDAFAIGVTFAATQQGGLGPVSPSVATAGCRLRHCRRR